MEMEMEMENSNVAQTLYWENTFPISDFHIPSHFFDEKKKKCAS